MAHCPKETSFDHFENDSKNIDHGLNNNKNNTTDYSDSTDTVPSTPEPDPEILGSSSALSQVRPPLDLRARWYILEPVVFLLYLSINLSGTVLQNQILYQTCVAVFHHNRTECEPLKGVEKGTEDTQYIENEVQPYVARFFMIRSLLEGLIPAFVSLFIGPWSDKFGRRPILLTTTTGYFLGFLILTTLSCILTKVVFLSPWIFLLSSVPSTLTGGTCALTTGIYCYITDVATNKAQRLVINMASAGAGLMIANVISGYLYAASNFITVFAISTILMMLSLLYTYVFVLESLNTQELQAGSRIREFFRFDLVKDLLSTCIKRRSNSERMIIWVTMTGLVVASFTSAGGSNVTYLFLRKKFAWTLKDFSTFNSVAIVIQVIGSVLAMIILRRILKFAIVTMTLLSLGCCILDSTIRGLATASWELYLGMTVGFMEGLLSPMLRSIIALVAPATEVGKIFALTNSMETISPLGSAPLYTSVYNTSLEFYPGAFNFISAGLYLALFGLVASIYGKLKLFGNNNNHNQIEDTMN